MKKMLLVTGFSALLVILLVSQAIKSRQDDVVLRDLGADFIAAVKSDTKERVSVPLDTALSTYYTSLDRVKHLVKMQKFDVNSDIAFEKVTMKPLHFAAYHNRADIVEYLIKKGAAVNAKDSTGKTAMDYALMNPDKQDTSAVVNFLLQGGAKQPARQK